jgi:maleylacetoacetate isomerase
MKLYTFFRSSAAYRVRIALNLKRIDYDSIPKAFAKNEHRAAEYLALNPQGLIPTLDDDGAILSQSLAIIEYLNEKYPTPALLPADLQDRAHLRSMALAVACDIHPLNNLRVLNYLRQQLKQDDEAVNAWYRHWVSAGFEGLEQQVRRHSKRERFCFADAVSLADVLLVPQMFNARRFQTDLTRFPTLVAISTYLETLPEFAAARPEVQSDATA